ncbi:hypothetical protein HDF18_24055 [Mucilaginibacter sp. X5P1]|uniref:hypothetical protein n=1 Tax=Mucilaginibacter sp. X5P1 TaxID=2723088 RepID=UPI0016183BE6|nr:hypothetical protein [Mucilaginibacter sp. X5P1]MBB6141204.1 hypothetical protein [Mucilaginibacter sp. X5P1]
MIVVFFKNNVDYVLTLLKHNDNSCGLWYSPGLNSYTDLASIISISKIYIEEDLVESFNTDHPSFLSQFPYETFAAKAVTVTDRKVCFFVSNDTHIFLFQNLLKKQTLPWDLYSRKGENAKGAGEKIGLVTKDFELSIPDVTNYNLLVCGNDWGPLEQRVNLDFMKNDINTICIQESVIDFNKRDKRMLYCCLPIYQGVVTLKNVPLNGKVCAVIGNPRYEELKPFPIPEKLSVFVNVNFTYGIHEDARDNWVGDIVSSCAELNIDYAICQHPRDRGDFSKFNLIKTNASTVHDSLKQSTILITRFSSLIHEALCLGRPVIYYNPHGEKLFYDFEPDNKCLFYATTKDDLLKALSSLSSHFVQDELNNSIKTYLSRHLGVTRSGKASDYINELIGDATYYPIIVKPTFYMLFISKLKRLKRILLRQKM